MTLPLVNEPFCVVTVTVVPDRVIVLMLFPPATPLVAPGLGGSTLIEYVNVLMPVTVTVAAGTL